MNKMKAAVFKITVYNLYIYFLLCMISNQKVKEERVFEKNSIYEKENEDKSSIKQNM